MLEEDIILRTCGHSPLTSLNLSTHPSVPTVPPVDWKPNFSSHELEAPDEPLSPYRLSKCHWFLVPWSLPQPVDTLYWHFWGPWDHVWTLSILSKPTPNGSIWKWSCMQQFQQLFYGLPQIRQLSHLHHLHWSSQAKSGVLYKEWCLSSRSSSKWFKIFSKNSWTFGSSQVALLVNEAMMGTARDWCTVLPPALPPKKGWEALTISFHVKERSFLFSHPSPSSLVVQVATERSGLQHPKIFAQAC